MNASSLFTYNQEKVDSEKIKKEVKLISFEDILINSTQKIEGGAAISMAPRQIKDQILTELDALKIIDFQKKDSKKTKILEKVRKFNEEHVKPKRSLSFFASNFEEDKLSVKSSQYSEKLSEKMIENIRKNHVDSPVSKKSDKESNIPSLKNGIELSEGSLHFGKKAEKEIEQSNEGNKVVISLVKFIKNADSQKFSLKYPPFSMNFKKERFNLKKISRVLKLPF